MKKTLLALIVCSLVPVGCADPGSVVCNNTAMTFAVAPATATANHSSAAPGNQVQFKSTLAPTPQAGCPTPTFIAVAYPTWTNPDPLDISISSAQDSTNGTAVCSGMTSGTVTLTATETTPQQTYMQNVTLTCQ